MCVCVCVCRCTQGNVLVLPMLPLHSYPQKKGEKCELCVFRCDGAQSRAASNRRKLAGKSILLGLALLLAAQMPFSPVHFTSRIPENGETCEMRVFRCYGARARAASSGINTYQQVWSARASPHGVSPISSRPSCLSPLLQCGLP